MHTHNRTHRHAQQKETFVDIGQGEKRIDINVKLEKEQETNP